MNKNLRLSERVYQRILWGVAFVFAGFLIGLGRLVVGDMPAVERPLSLESFLDTKAADPIRRNLDELTAERRELSDALETRRLTLTAAEQDVEQAQTSFKAWATTRQVTQDTLNDPQVAQRVRQIDALVAREREAQRAVEEVNRQNLQLGAKETAEQEKLRKLQADAAERYDAAMQRQAIRVFGWRLAVTVPLLLIAGWLLARRRNSKYWPFVYGFAIFAGFTFFVELVPYLPSYGGYVRYGVGVAGTLIGGLYLIRALTRYREQQRIIEAQGDAQRRAALSYEMVMARLAKKVCPGCERLVHPDDPGENFCPHCGLCLFDRCARCDTRKNAFSRFCSSCGSPAASASVPDITS
jgi:predicted RNA-binding Zn-ribbon protein involved in translation (DUF1610 family)